MEPHMINFVELVPLQRDSVENELFSLVFVIWINHVGFIIRLSINTYANNMLIQLILLDLNQNRALNSGRDYYTKFLKIRKEKEGFLD